MKKKFLLTVLLLCTIVQPVMAKNIKVQAMSEFSTANPSKTWKLKVVESVIDKNGNFVAQGSVIEGNIEDITPPARLKRNASFVFIPTKFYDIDGKVYHIEKGVVGKYSILSDVSVGGIAKQGAVIAGNKLVDGFFGPGVALVEGAVKNEQGNRFKSAAVSVYESTPLSYVNKGKEVVIQKDQVFIMSFKEIEQPQEEKPNYEYSVE